MNVQKKQSDYYSGKKKQHTLKTQIIYRPDTCQIISVHIDKGRHPDVKIARKHINELIGIPFVLADLGYKGLKNIGFKLLIPIKKRKKLPLPIDAKQINRAIGRRRIVIEHINSRLKCFAILSQRYRNRRKRFGLRVNLIAGLLNWMAI